MVLTPGTRLGPYEITAAIGSGGMGEVYRATDTNLKRQVAIKVLPEAVANDPERLARFRREAEVLAALNHPNIAQIHGLEDSDGQVALVMELVEGPTLADLIHGSEARGERPKAKGSSSSPLPLASRQSLGLPVEDALAIARQVAEGLEAAHEQGIIHRDLKPANIKVRDDGTVKVLDFGLAKALEPTGASSPDVTHSPTITSPAVTERGVILGTAAYMSPEQAKGRSADRRSDIWSFGAVLYEMLTGRRAFQGEDVSDTMASVLKADADWNAFPATVPATAVAVIKRCLQRDRALRARDIGDVRLALDGAFESPQSVDTAAMPARSSRRRALSAAALLLVGVVLGAAGAWLLRGTSESGSSTRFVHPVPPELSFRATGRSFIALARDGQSLVYNTQAGLFRRRMDSEEAVLIPGTEVNLGNPFFDPGGRTIGYYDRVASELRRIDVTGGASVRIADAEPPFGVSWESDGTILFGQGEGIVRVAATGDGMPVVVIPAREGEQLSSPQLLPDQDSVLFSVNAANEDEAQVVIESISARERTVLVAGGSSPHYVAQTGHLVYESEGALVARAFDLGRRTFAGLPVPVVERIRRAGTGAALYSVSDSGTLVFLRDMSDPRREVVWVDREGEETSLPFETLPYGMARLSPDGSRVALATQGAAADIFVGDLNRGSLLNITASDARDRGPVWMWDNTSLVFVSDRGGGDELYRLSADGSGTPEPLSESTDGFPSSLSPDGWLILLVARAETGQDLSMLDLSGDGAAQDLLRTEFQERNAYVSPNGRWVAYASNRGVANNNIVVSPFPDAASQQWQISPRGGTLPAWAPDGRELFYVDSGRFMSVEVDPDQDVFVFGQPTELFSVSEYIVGGARAFDVADERFLFLKPLSSQPTAGANAQQIHVVQNWFEELQRLVPTP